MQIPRFSLIISLIALCLSACGTSSNEQTLVAQHHTVSTEIAYTRQTASVVRARMQTTLDFAGTRVIDVEQLGQFLQSTLVALGTERAYISNNLPLPGSVSFPTFTPLPTSPINIQANSQPTIPVDPNATEELNTQGEPISATPPAGQSTLSNIVLASGVDNNDCAIDSNPRFTTNSTEIYVVAIANNIPAGTEISSTWQRAGIEVALFSFAPEASLNNVCIWFFIDQTDTEFVAANWSVELKINGVSASPPIPFTIVEP